MGRYNDELQAEGNAQQTKGEAETDGTERHATEVGVALAEP